MRNSLWNNRRLPIFAILALAAVGKFADANAAIITVTNPGFQALANQNYTFNSVSHLAGTDIAGGLYVNSLDGSLTGSVRKVSDDLTFLADSPVTTLTATVAGWVPTVARSGVVSRGPSDNTSGLLNVGNVGNLVTWTNQGTGMSGFSQTLPGHVQLLPFTTYTLSMQLLLKELPVSPNFTADLTVAGSPVGGSLAYLAPTSSSLGSAVVTYTTGAIPPSGDLGIRILATDLSGNLTQILLDNVTLTAVPEPGCAALATLAAIGVISAQRIRRV